VRRKKGLILQERTSVITVWHDLREEAEMKPFLLPVAVAVLCGCESIGRQERDTAAPDADATVYVFGVRPAQARIWMISGNITQDGRFSEDGSGIAAFMSNPVDQFIVGRAAAGKSLGVLYVKWVEPGERLPGFKSTLFLGCRDGTRTLVFDTPGGKVIYLGDLDFDAPSRQISSHDDFERARKRLPMTRGCTPVELMTLTD
jgi:hypothetical protein